MEEYGRLINIPVSLSDGTFKSADEAYAFVFRAAAEFVKAKAPSKKPDFVWRQNEKGEDLVGWYCGPPSRLKRRMEHEGLRVIDPFALAECKIVPLLKS